MEENKETEVVIQKEINRIEKRTYTIRNIPFQPNIKEKCLTPKFYARHDFSDEYSPDPELENAIFKAKMLHPKEKYKEPLTTNMEYGWYTEPRVIRSKFTFNFPRTSCPVTRIGALIALENQKMPKKQFMGKTFLF